jgi:hypothetical protein
MWKRIFLVFSLSQAIATTQLNDNKNSTLDSLNELSLLVGRAMKSFYCGKSTVDLTTMSANDSGIEGILAFILPTIGDCTTIRISSEIGMKTNNIAVMKDQRDFTAFISSEHFDFRGFHTIIFTSTNVDLEAVFAQSWSSSISNINAIVKSQENWHTFTYHPFSNGICGNAAAVEVNASDLFPEKIKNLQRCPIKFPKLNYYPGLIIQQMPDGSMSLSGIDGDIIKELMMAFNFTVEILKLTNEEERWGEFK